MYKSDDQGLLPPTEDLRFLLVAPVPQVWPACPHALLALSRRDQHLQ